MSEPRIKMDLDPPTVSPCSHCGRSIHSWEDPEPCHQCGRCFLCSPSPRRQIVRQDTLPQFPLCQACLLGEAQTSYDGRRDAEILDDPSIEPDWLQGDKR